MEQLLRLSIDIWNTKGITNRMPNLKIRESESLGKDNVGFLREVEIIEKFKRT